MKPVYQCVCHGVTFHTMKLAMAEHNINDLESLQEINPCAMCCKFCVPYINQMIKTGETSFDVIKPTCIQ